MKRWLILLACFAVSSFGQQQVNDLTDANQIIAQVIQDDQVPLWVVNYTLDSKSYLSPITFQNQTEKEITGFELTWIVAVPSGCSQVSANEGVSLDKRSLSLDIVVGPNKTVSLKAYQVPTSKLFAIAKTNKAAFLDLQFAVTHVTFADGSTWASPYKGGILSESELQDHGKQCSAGHLMKQTSRCEPIQNDPELSATTSSAASPNISFRCFSTVMLEGCSVADPNTKCTNFTCHDRDQCPFQYCAPGNPGP